MNLLVCCQLTILLYTFTLLCNWVNSLLYKSNGNQSESVFGCNYDGDEVSGNTLYEGTYLENVGNFVTGYLPK